MNVALPDQELIDSLFGYLQRHHIPGERYVAAIIKTVDGKEYKGMHMRHFANKMCAKLAALAVLLSSKDEIEGPLTVAAATFVEEEPRVVNSCGRCRQVLGDYFPDARFIMNDSGVLRNASLGEVLPFLYLKDGKTA